MVVFTMSGGFLRFSRIQESLFFSLTAANGTFDSQVRCKKSSKVQQGVSDKHTHTTSHRKLKANFQSCFTYSYAPEAVSECKRKKERKKKGHNTSRLFNFFY